MTTHKTKRPALTQLQDITAFAHTLSETSCELHNLINRHHPESHQFTWLIRQTHERIHEILTALGEEL